LLLLSQTTNTIERTKNGIGPRAYPHMLPQWAINICRPIIRVLCRLLWRVRWINKENIPASGGLIVAANHQTYIDPFWISSIIRRPVRFLAWDAAFSWPIVGWAMRLLGAWPLQLEGTDPAPIRRSIQWVSEGGVVVIFPEGGRGQADGSMKKFKAGAARMAIEAGVPILPVTIIGGHRVWPAGKNFPRLEPVEVIYHPPLVLEAKADEDSRACARRVTEELQAIIGSALPKSSD
jgi:1-acyl-sn-glycerol-3-phosphate acyltransferase